MITIFTDGACEPNPGMGGWSFAVYENGIEIDTRKGGDLQSTNNIMEMTGVLCALDYAKMKGMKPSGVVICSDSQYCVKGCNTWRHSWKSRGWRRGKEGSVANVGLWQSIAIAHDAFPCKIQWVKGHSGIIGNERADELANEGRLLVMNRAGMEEAA